MTTFAKRTVHLVVVLGTCLFLVGTLSAQESGALPGEGPMPAAPIKAMPKPVPKPAPTNPGVKKTAPKSPATKPAAAAQVAPKPVTPKPAITAGPKPAAKSGPKLAVAPKQPIAAGAKPGSKPAPKQETAKKEPAEKPAPSAAPEPAENVSADAGGAKRDPFVSLVSVKHDMGGPVLPPGKAGLVVATVRIDGTVRSGDGMIAMVSNPEKHVYFIREGDRLYDGDVEKISLEGVTFREESKDAFGKPVERTVTKRIYQSAGEQQ